jgi:hypothetical protein
MISDGFTINGLYGMSLALTPSERWQAARTPSQGLLTNHWFILACVVVMVALTVLLFWVSLQRVRQENQVSDRAFIDLAEEKSLTVRECQILRKIAKRSRVPRQEAVFTDRSAFERGAAQMIANTLSGKESQKKQPLITEVSLLREKIGFGKSYAALGANQSRSRSSRQIPVAKRVTLRRMPVGETAAVEVIVHSNKDHEFCVQLDEAIKVTLGGLWIVRYFHGASVWEFDTSVISYDGTVLALTHSDHVRFVNRRRFLRVPVVRRALVAKFPFEQTMEWADTAMTVKRDQKEIKAVHPIDAYGTPEFVPATVTEMGGPGLRIETLLDVRAGQRVLVVFDLEVEPLVSDDPSTRDRRSRLIEDIGEVRHVKHLEKGVSVAVELSGLKDADVNELIRATNAALIEINEKAKTVNENHSRAMTQAVAV